MFQTWELHLQFGGVSTQDDLLFVLIWWPDKIFQIVQVLLHIAPVCSLEN